MTAKISLTVVCKERVTQWPLCHIRWSLLSYLPHKESAEQGFVYHSCGRILWYCHHSSLCCYYDFFFFLESKNIYSITDIVNVKLKIYTNIRSWQTMLKLTFYFFFKPHTRILHTCTQMNILKQEIWQLPENGLWLISPSFSIKLLSAFETPDQLSITLHKFQHWHKMRPGQTKNPIRLSGGHTSFYT